MARDRLRYELKQTIKNVFKAAEIFSEIFAVIVFFPPLARACAQRFHESCSLLWDPVRYTSRATSFCDKTDTASLWDAIYDSDIKRWLRRGWISSNTRSQTPLDALSLLHHGAAAQDLARLDRLPDDYSFFPNDFLGIGLELNCIQKCDTPHTGRREQDDTKRFR